MRRPELRCDCRGHLVPPTELKAGCLGNHFERRGACHILEDFFGNAFGEIVHFCIRWEIVERHHRQKRLQRQRDGNPCRAFFAQQRLTHGLARLHPQFTGKQRFKRHKSPLRRSRCAIRQISPNRGGHNLFIGGITAQPSIGKCGDIGPIMPCL